MSKMNEVTNNYLESINEMTNLIKNEINADKIMNMSAEEFRFMKSAITLINSVNELMETYGEYFDSIDRKLDNVLVLLSKKES